jgi:hypothetical protein
MRRRFIEEHSFSDAALKIGVYAVDKAMEPIIEALVRNPYGFPSIENDFVRFRYAVIKKTQGSPALVVIFTIDDDGTVRLRDVEKADFPYGDV